MTRHEAIEYIYNNCKGEMVITYTRISGKEVMFVLDLSCNRTYSWDGETVTVKESS